MLDHLLGLMFVFANQNVHVIGHDRTRVASVALGFDDLLAAEPHLLDKDLPFRHWSPETMAGD